MNNIVYLNPSFYAHIVNAIFLLVAFILFYKNFSEIMKTKPDKLIIIMLLFSLAIGVHGLSHLGLESVYGYNPMKTLISSS